MLVEYGANVNDVETGEDDKEIVQGFTINRSKPIRSIRFCKIFNI
jgi:hypothetical protein